MASEGHAWVNKRETDSVGTNSRGAGEVPAVPWVMHQPWAFAGNGYHRQGILHLTTYSLMIQ